LLNVKLLVHHVTSKLYLKTQSVKVKKVAVFSQINTKHINTVRAERTVVEC